MVITCARDFPQQLPSPVPDISAQHRYFVTPRYASQEQGERDADDQNHPWKISGRRSHFPRPPCARPFVAIVTVGRISSSGRCGRGVRAFSLASISGVFAPTRRNASGRSLTSVRTGLGDIVGAQALNIESRRDSSRHADSGVTRRHI